MIFFRPSKELFEPLECRNLSLKNTTFLFLHKYLIDVYQKELNLVSFLDTTKVATI